MLWLAFLLSSLFAEQLFLRDATVILLPGVTRPRLAHVVIDKGRIQHVSPNLKPGKRARVIEAKGKYIIPGLWDAHFHLIQPATQTYTRTVFLPMLLSMGITSVRDMGSMLHSIVALREEIATGRVFGPRVFTSGPMIDSPPSKPSEIMLLAANGPEAAAIASRLSEQHVDFLKVQQNLTPEAYRAVLQEGRKRNLAVMGHTPDLIEVDELAKSGQRSLEHLTGVLTSCSTKEGEIREAVSQRKVAVLDFGPLGEPGRWTLDNYSSAKAHALATLLVRHKVSVCPTLSWEKAYTAASVRRRPQNGPLLNRYFAKALEVTALLARSGVPVLAGTDGGDEFTTPGASLHEELELLVSAGLSPLDALRAATVNPAQLLHQPLDRADVVILDGDPLASISNTRRIHAVITAGKLLDRAALDKLQAAARVAASRGK